MDMFLPDPNPANARWDSSQNFGFCDHTSMNNLSFVVDDTCFQYETQPLMNNLSFVNANFQDENTQTTPTKNRIDFSSIPPAPKKSRERKRSKLPLSAFDNDIVPINRPIVPRQNGKQMIKMCDENKKKRNRSKRNVNKNDDEEKFALRKMEPFVCMIFCGKCQENAHFDGRSLNIKACERCCIRLSDFKM
ncbi:unnamed protein product [Caenorhabditis brenneri]